MTSPKEIVKKTLKNPLIAGSSVLFAGIMFANFGNYLYHLLMGRMLGPQNYGALISLISLAYIFSIISTALSTTVVKFVTKYKAKKDFKKIYQLFWRLKIGFLVFGAFLFVAFFLIKDEISQFLNIPDSSPVLLVSIWMVIGFLSFINEGTLRAFLKFNFLSFNSIFGTIMKLGLAVFLVRIGFSVNGALGAIILGTLLPYLISFLPLRFLNQYKDGKEKIPWNEFFSYSGPVLVAVLGLTSLYSSDVILVKHLFPAYEAGLYASLAVLGKIVFFGSSTVQMVMFPLVSERFENGKNYQNFFKQSFLIVAGISLVITTIYFSFPRLMIHLLYGPAYLKAAPYLGIFAVFISLYSLSSLLVNFFFSIKKVMVGLFPLFAAISQICLILVFHSSVAQVIGVSIGVSALLLFSLLLFYWQNEKR